MVEGKAKLIVDLGNSETRVRTIFGKTKSGRPRQRLTLLPNKFGELPDERLLKNQDYDSENSKVFMVEGGTILCSGEMCDKEKGTAALRPSSSIKKYDSAITMYTIRLAFLQGYLDIADMTKQDLNSIDVEWSVTVLLPPSDLELGAEKMKESIMGLSNIKFLMPEFCKSLNITSVKVFPEGFCAFIGEVFENSKKIRDGFENVLTSATLVIDIGAGTTDLDIIKDAKLVDSSRYSEETGGNQVFQKVNTELRKKCGKNFPEDSLREASVTGTIKVGASSIDITGEIEVAKKDVATKLSNAIRNYIESSDFSIFDIENILICGGGADNCGSNLKPLGDYLKENLEVWMNYSNFLEIPEQEVVTEEGGNEIVTKEKISPRLLNIIGAGILSEN